MIYNFLGIGKNKLFLFLSFILFSCHASTAEIMAEHIIQQGTSKGDFIHAFIGFGGDLVTDIDIQFNLDKAQCNFISPHKGAKVAPFVGSASSARMIMTNTQQYHLLSLGAYGLALPCKNLKMNIFDKNTKEHIFSYDVGNMSKVTNKLNKNGIYEKVFISNVVDQSVRLNLVLENYLNVKRKLFDLKLKFKCQNDKRFKEVLYKHNLGKLLLKSGDVFSLVTELGFEEINDDIENCRLIGSYSYNEDGVTKTHELSNVFFNKIQYRTKIKLITK